MSKIEVAFTNENNDKLAIQQWRGKIVILHFWATWGAYCIHEMVDLNKFSALLQEHELEKRIVIAPVSIDSNLEQVQDFYRKMFIRNLPLYLDKNQQAFKKLRLSAVPCSFIINTVGETVFNLNGVVEWNSTTLNKVKSFLPRDESN